METVRRLAASHDELPAFHAASLALTVVFAALLNTGACAVLVAGHIALDIVKYRELFHYSWSRTAKAVLRESIVDLFLLSIALVAALYLHHTAGIFAVRGIIRIEASVIRASALVIPSFGVLNHLFAIFKNIQEHMHDVRWGQAGPWKSAERSCLKGLLICLAFVLIAPLILPESATIGNILRDELIPWKF